MRVLCQRRMVRDRGKLAVQRLHRIVEHILIVRDLVESEGISSSPLVVGKGRRIRRFSRGLVGIRRSSWRLRCRRAWMGRLWS